MNKRTFLSVAILVLLAQPVLAITVSRQATITGGGGAGGKCTLEVDVDGSAEVEVSGDLGHLTTISGQPASWRRFQCNVPLPPKPVDFRLVRTDGNRGTVRLLQDPRGTGGRAAIHIKDPRGGRGVYTFDLQWRGPGGGGWMPGPAPPPSAFPMTRVIRVCQDFVTDRLNQRGYQYVTFEHTMPVDNPGRHDWITGTAIGTRGFGSTWFTFSCSVDFNSGRIRSVDVQRR